MSVGMATAVPTGVVRRAAASATDRRRPEPVRACGAGRARGAARRASSLRRVNALPSSGMGLPPPAVTLPGVAQRPCGPSATLGRVKRRCGDDAWRELQGRSHNAERLSGLAGGGRTLRPGAGPGRANARRVKDFSCRGGSRAPCSGGTCSSRRARQRRPSCSSAFARARAGSRALRRAERRDG